MRTEIAGSYGNPALEPEHLLAALIQDPQGTVVPILQKTGANVNAVKLKVHELIERLPKVSRLLPGQSRGCRPRWAASWSTPSSKARELKDEYVSTEHLVLALVEASDGLAAKLLKDQGVTPETILRVLKDIRGITARDRPDTRRTSIRPCSGTAAT